MCWEHEMGQTCEKCGDGGFMRVTYHASDVSFPAYFCGKDCFKEWLIDMTHEHNLNLLKELIAIG